MSLLLLKDKGKQQQFTAKMGNFTPTPSAPTPCKTSRFKVPFGDPFRNPSGVRGFCSRNERLEHHPCCNRAGLLHNGKRAERQKWGKNGKIVENLPRSKMGKKWPKNTENSETLLGSGDSVAGMNVLNITLVLDEVSEKKPKV